jgi:ATP-dependent Lhr-like helicase
VASWCAASFPAATEAQLRASPLIQAGRPALVAAPTGSGKTLTASLAAIDDLVRESEDYISAFVTGFDVEPPQSRPA